MNSKQLNTHFEKRDIELILLALAEFACENLADEKLYKEIDNISDYMNEELDFFCDECPSVLKKSELNQGTCDDCINERHIYEMEARSIRDMYK